MVRGAASRGAGLPEPRQPTAPQQRGGRGRGVLSGAHTVGAGGVTSGGSVTERQTSGVSLWAPGARPSSPLAQGAAVPAAGARGGLGVSHSPREALGPQRPRHR